MNDEAENTAIRRRQYERMDKRYRRQIWTAIFQLITAVALTGAIAILVYRYAVKNENPPQDVGAKNR
jgi:fatty acid desaturase